MIDIKLCSKDDCVVVHYVLSNDKTLKFFQKLKQTNNYENTYCIKRNCGLIDVKSFSKYWIMDFIKNNKKTYMKIYDINENILSSWIYKLGYK